MKKFAKMSLVAAVAVAGMTSTVSAKDLSEAIKGVDVSGTITYRYDDRNSDDANNPNITNNSYKAAITVKSPINDDMTAVTKFIAGDGSSEVVIGAGGADGTASVDLVHANFVYTGIANTSIIAGKQAVPSPFAVQADALGDESHGTGLTAITTVGPVTAAATYFNSTNLVSEGQAVAGLGLMANVGPVALDAWYLDIKEKTDNDGHDAFTIGASTKIAMVDLYARFSQVGHEANGADDEELFKVGAKAKFGIFGAGIDYGQTNDVNTVTTGVGLNANGDADAKVSLQGWGLNLEGKDDAQLIKTNVNVDVMSGLNFAVNYVDYSTDAAANEDADEVYGQLTWKPSKNFMTYIRIGQVDADNRTDEGQRGRLHVQYSF